MNGYRPVIVVLGAWAGVAMARVAAGFKPLDALQVSIPGSIVAALGLSAGSFAFSAGIKSQQAKRPTVVALGAEQKAQLTNVKNEINSVNEQIATQRVAATEQGLDDKVREALKQNIEELEAKLAALETERTRLTDLQSQARGATGVLVTNASPADADPVDIFSGEQVGAADTIDFGKVQMFIVTLVIVGAYGLAIAGAIDDRSLLGRDPSFPDIPETLVGIFALSHAGYLAVKAPTRPSKP